MHQRIKFLGTDAFFGRGPVVHWFRFLANLGTWGVVEKRIKGREFLRMISKQIVSTTFSIRFVNTFAVENILLCSDTLFLVCPVEETWKWLMNFLLKILIITYSKIQKRELRFSVYKFFSFFFICFP